MFRVLYCLQANHDPWFVALAALVCLGSCLTSVFLLSRAQMALTTSNPHRRIIWTVVSGLVLGFGIWATHFIAMLAYNAGIPMRYDLWLTLASLVFAMGMTTLGLTTLGMPQLLGRSQGTIRAALTGGVLTGIGISGMHFMGMSALQFPGRIVWAWDLVTTALLVSALFSTLAFRQAQSEATLKSRGLSALYLVLGIAGLHFIAMGAVQIVPDPLRAFSGQGLSQGHMSIVITLITFLISATSLTAALAGQRRDRELAATERNFSLIVDAVTDYAIYRLDADGLITSWNPGAERITGFKADEVIGTNVSRFYTAEAQATNAPKEALRAALEDGGCSEEGLRVKKNGQTFWALVTITPIHDAAGLHIGFAKITRDVSEQKSAQDELLTLKNMLGTAISHMSQGLCLFDADERVILHNPRLLEIFCLSPAQLAKGTTLRETVRDVIINRLGRTPTPDEIDERYRVHKEAMEKPNGGQVFFEFNQRRMVMNYRPLPDGGWVSTTDDITESLATKDRIDFLATHDSLTELANRDQFNRKLSKALARAVEKNTSLAVICLDIDQFHAVNDRHSHAIGDDVLREVAKRLRGKTGSQEFVARIGGDEFALFKPLTEQAEFSTYLEGLSRALNRPMLIGGANLNLRICLGSAIAPDHGTDFDTLINNAKLAQGRAKLDATALYSLYQPDMDDAARQKRLLADDLNLALSRNEFQVYYQVQKSIKTGMVTGYEALVRWFHPTLGLVSPADFIPLAEDTGVIFDLGEWVLRTACRDAESLPAQARIAVNLSPLQLNRPDLVRRVHEILLETGLEPSRLELEITESSLVSDKTRAMHTLRQLKALGLTIAMDDFGTGYSSLETLNAFPFDKIKIDRSFLMTSHQSRQSLAIMRAIIALGKSLGIPVLCEGVETLEHVALLAAEGCDEVQGFLYGRPMPLSEALSVDHETRWAG